MKTLKYIGSVLIIVLAACSQDVLNEDPPHLITSNSLYSTYEGFQSGINGLYDLVREEHEGYGSALVKGLFMNGTDQLVTNHDVSGFASISERWQDLNNPSAGMYAAVFEWLYSVVNASNTIIKNAEERTDVDWSAGPGSSESNKSMVIAEARAIRAWAHRHLTFLWGDVPLNLQESSGTNIRTDWERTPVSEVRDQIIKDLLFAQEYIPIEPTNEGSITKGAIQHYLSEMYLTINKPDSSLFWANQVINTPAYSLIEERYGTKANEPGIPFMDMFYAGNVSRQQGNSEALWIFPFEQNVIGGGSSPIRRHHHSRYVSISIEGVSPLQVTLERGGRGYGRMSLTKWAIDNYEASDERGSHFAIRKFFVLKNAEQNAPYPADRLPPGYTYGDTIHLDWSHNITPATNSRVDWPWSRKVDAADPQDVGGSPSYKDWVYLRLADTYLLKAEAQFKLGLLGEAAETLNIIRRRSNASEISASDVDIDFILDERSRELVLEEHRRYTLLRTGKWKERTMMYNENGGQFITDRDTIFPIPQSVIDANLTGEIEQNPGY